MAETITHTARGWIPPVMEPEIPFDEFLPEPRVVAITSLSRSSLRRLIDNNLFPRPLKIGKSRIAFRASEVRAWLASRPKA